MSIRARSWRICGPARDGALHEERPKASLHATGWPEPYDQPVRAEHPLPDDLPSRLSDLADAWNRDPDIAAVYLFGSRARSGASSRSDVDLAVVLQAAWDPAAALRKRIALIQDACVRLGTDAVDLIVLDEAPSTLAHRALRDGRLLVDSNPRRRVQVVEDVFRRYLDEAPIRAELDRALAARAREGRLAR